MCYLQTAIDVVLPEFLCAFRGCLTALPVVGFAILDIYPVLGRSVPLGSFDNCLAHVSVYTCMYM